MQVACSSEMSAFFYQTTGHHTSQKGNPHNHHFQTSFLIYLHLLMYRLNDRGNMNFVCASWIVQRQYQQIEVLFSNANKITDLQNVRHICMKIHDCLNYLHIFCNNFYSHNYGSAVSSWIKHWGYMAFPHPHFPSGLKNNATWVSNFKMSTFWSGDLGFGCATHFYPRWLRKLVLPKKCKSFCREYNFLFPSLTWVAWSLTSLIHLVKCRFLDPIFILQILQSGI
jgi:hypothetical protein